VDAGRRRCAHSRGWKARSRKVEEHSQRSPICPFPHFPFQHRPQGKPFNPKTFFFSSILLQLGLGLGFLQSLSFRTNGGIWASVTVLKAPKTNLGFLSSRLFLLLLLPPPPPPPPPPLLRTRFLLLKMHSLMSLSLILLWMTKMSKTLRGMTIELYMY